MADAPWEGLALQRVARGLDLAPDEVPRAVFFDFEALGGMNLGVDAYVHIGLWQGAMAVGLALGVAALAARWWVPLVQRRPQALSEGESRFRAGRGDWVALGVILLAAGAIRAPHLDRAIYFDEQDNLRRNFHGHLEISPDGRETWRGAGWQEALWENRLGNNPVLLSVASQASLRSWRKISGAERQRFDVVALRAPVLAAGLASIAALWWLLQLWGLRFGAGFAALLAAIHPMHIDYSLQARGYAFVLLFVPLALGFAWLALRRDRWRDWCLMALCVFLCLWSYAGSVYFALALNGGLLARLVWLRAREGDPARWGPVCRLLAVNAGSALLYAFLIFPHLPQLSHHFRNVFELIPLSPAWISYAWSHYSTGTNFPAVGDFRDLREGSATLGDVLLGRFAAAEPLLAGLQWLVIPALILFGMWRLRRAEKGGGGPAPAFFLMALGFAAPLLALVHHQFTSLYFYYWYLSFLLPVAIAGVALGWQGIRWRRPGLRGLAASAFLAFFLWQTSSWHGGKGRLDPGRPWPVTEAGEETVEWRRGSSHWIATRDGRSISLRDYYTEEGERRRAGR